MGQERHPHQQGFKPKNDKKEIRSKLHAMTPNNECKQTRKRKTPSMIEGISDDLSEVSKKQKVVKGTKSYKPSEKTVATFEEDDQIVEIQAEGQSSEFDSEESDEGKSVVSQSTQTELDVEDNSETEVFFKEQVNNNASQIFTDGEEVLDDSFQSKQDGREEGECSFNEDLGRTSEEPDGEGKRRSQNKSANDKDSLTEQIDNKIKSSFDSFQNYFDQKFENMLRVMELEKKLADNQRHLEELKVRGTKEINDNAKSNTDKLDTNSEVTIYRNAIEKGAKHDSSSLEEFDLINSSDEFIEQSIILERWIQKEGAMRTHEQDDPGASTSRQSGGDIQVVKEKQKITNNKDEVNARALEVVQSAEAAKARILDVKGNDNAVNFNINNLRLETAKALGHSMGDNYMLVASHVDEVTRDKILNHEYIDFVKLLRKDRPGSNFEEDQQRMMMVNKGGMSYWMPMERSNSINSYHKWDQSI